MHNYRDLQSKLGVSAIITETREQADTPDTSTPRKPALGHPAMHARMNPDSHLEKNPASNHRQGYRAVGARVGGVGWVVSL